MGFFGWLLKRKKPRVVKLGLALGSGGAKGFAELGVLRALEENGLSFDIIAGTSIGSIIGAFTAQGFSSTDIYELLRRVDVSEIKKFVMINMDTSGLFKVIDRSIGSLKIEELKKPFFAVATELDSGEEKVFSSGSVAAALCASSSYPPFFKPAVIDGKRYIDGAFTNSVPSDIVKNAGAEYVVAVDLSVHEKKQGVLSKLFPTYESKVKEPWAKGYSFADTVIHPDLSDYSAVAFSSGEYMYEIGYKAAIALIPKIKNDIEKLKSRK